MPLHLEGICKNGIAPEAVSETVEELYNTPTSSFSSINRFYHLRTEMVDENTGDTIGHFVLSVIRNEKADRNDVVDTDLSFKSAEPVRLWFEQMAGPTVYGSQGYEAITLDDDIDEQYLYLETVNRYTDYPNLNTHEADVYISVFPTEVAMYDSMEALNAATGKEYTDRFIEESDDISFLVGTVQSACGEGQAGSGIRTGGSEDRAGHRSRGHVPGSVRPRRHRAGQGAGHEGPHQRRSGPR